MLLAAEGRVSRRAIYRFFHSTSSPTYEAGIAITLHALADHRATYPADHGQDKEQRLLKVIHRLVTTYFEQQDQVVDPPLLLTGRDLIGVLGMSEGRLIGLLLQRLKEAQAAGQIKTPSEALDFIKADPDFARSQVDDL